MKLNKFVSDLLDTLAIMKSGGTKSIDIDHLITYLNLFKNKDDTEMSAAEIEHVKAQLVSWNQENKYRQDFHMNQSIAMFNSVITAGQNAVKTSFLLNGGAAVAMLALLGHLAEFNQTQVKLFAGCLVPFCYGVLAIAITSGCTYLSQWFYGSDRKHAKKLGYLFNFLCIFMGFASYWYFYQGMQQSYAAFLNFN